MIEVALAIIIAIIGSMDDTSRMAVCDSNPHIVVAAQANGYTVFEDCSFTLED